MKSETSTLVLAIVLAASLGAFAAEKSKSAGGADEKFVTKAANGGLTEVELGNLASKNGEKSGVKDFGSQMVKDHGKANNDLKSVASKLSLTVPDKPDAKHQEKIDTMSKLSGAAFDSAYVKEMLAAHEKDIAEFEKARGEVSSAELKKFIDDTVPVMKEHLDMVKKMQGKD